MKPLARTRNLLIREIGSEVLIWDEETNECYCLNRFETMVWYKCDGQHTVEDIAKQLEPEMKLINKSSLVAYVVDLEINKLKEIQLIEKSWVTLQDSPSSQLD